jgi:hypothetical protein
MAEPLTVADFLSLVDHPFTLNVGAERLTLTLIEVKALKASRSDARTPFSLFFHGPAVPALRQGTYDFAHPSLGVVSIFVVPVEADAVGCRYQAIFN